MSNPPVAEAAGEAEVAARQAGVVVRELDSIAEFETAVRIFGEIWGRPDFPPMTMELLRALSTAGNYVAGVFSDDRLAGASAAFFEAPAARALHSHIGAVLPNAANRGAGRALKLHQRAWALERGVTTVAWTFDPLIRRNAYFNLAKLAARPVEYLPNFYGVMADRINAGDQTDRLLLHWDLLDPAVSAAARGHVATASAQAERSRGAAVVLGVDADGTPVPGRWSGSGRGLLAVPADIEALRLSDPGLAAAWRVALREALVSVLDAHARLAGFDPSGWYVVEPAAENEKGTR